MKWIDMLREKWMQMGEFVPSKSYSFTDSNKFLYDGNITDKDITVFINNCETGYQFKIINNEIDWSHPIEAKGLLSDEVKEHLINIVKDDK
jgi:hypothetical protein